MTATHGLAQAARGMMREASQSTFPGAKNVAADADFAMRLAPTLGNPIPDGLESLTVTARDGIRLRAAKLIVPRTRGTVVIAGGRGDFIERYFETIRDLTKRGFSVAAFDFRGQGGSQRPHKNPYRSRMSSFAEYDDDLTTVMTKLVLPDCPPPYLALGHSTGANVVLRALRTRTWFERAVLTSPLLGVDTGAWPMPVAKLLTHVMCLTGFGWVFLPGHLKRPLTGKGYDGNPFTSCRARFARDTATLELRPDLGVGGPSFSWLRAALRSMRELEALNGPDALRAPVLIIAAGQDRVVLTEAARQFARRVSNVSFVTIEESRHEISCETDSIRAQFLAAFDAFTAERR
jgi:lysophospholipase